MESRKLLLALISSIACVSLIDGGKCLYEKYGASARGAIIWPVYSRNTECDYSYKEVTCNATKGFPHFTKLPLVKPYSVSRMIINGNLSVIPKKAFTTFSRIGDLTLEHTTAGQHQSWHASAFQGVEVSSLKITNLDGVIPIPKALEPLGTEGDGLQYLTITGAGAVTLQAESFRNLSKLRTLTIERTKILNIDCDAFTGLSDLTQLTITDGGQGVTLKAECFHGLSKLNKMTIERTAISSIDRDAFAGLENLRYLTIIEGGNEDTLQAGCFSSLSKLSQLEIKRTTILSIDRDAFAGLSNLWELTIIGGTVPVGIRNLPNLRILSLWRTKISSIDHDAFAGLSNLETLILQSTSLTEFPQEAMDHLTSLREIVLSGNEFNGPTVPGLRSLPRKVASCKLENNGLTAFPTELISKTQFLNSLSLQNNNISSIIISTGFLYLESLYLSGNPITSIDLGGKLPKLRTLWLWEQKLSHVDLSSFRGTRLRDLNLSHSPYLKSINMSAEALLFDDLYFTNTGLELIDRSVMALFAYRSERTHTYSTYRTYMHIDHNKHLRCDEGMKSVVETVFSSDNYRTPRLYVGGSFCADKNITLDEFVVDTAIEVCERLWNSGDGTFCKKYWLESYHLDRFILTAFSSGTPKTTLGSPLSDKFRAYALSKG